MRDNFKVCAVATAFEIGDQCFGAVVRGVGVFRGVQHLEIDQAGAFVHRLPCFGAAGFVRAVIHDGDAGMNRIDKCA